MASSNRSERQRVCGLDRIKLKSIMEDEPSSGFYSDESEEGGLDSLISVGGAWHIGVGDEWHEVTSIDEFSVASFTRFRMALYGIIEARHCLDPTESSTDEKELLGYCPFGAMSLGSRFDDESGVVLITWGVVADGGGDCCNLHLFIDWLS